MGYHTTAKQRRGNGKRRKFNVRKNKQQANMYKTIPSFQDDKVYKACTDKQAYETKKSAKNAILKYQSFCTDRLTVYHCKFCSRWHLTSNADNYRQKRLRSF